MIGRLVGRIAEEDGAGGVLLDVGGVGYEVTTPLGTRGRAAADAAGHVTLWIHSHVREDAFQLFGFASAVERDAFRTVIGIPNVGPKLALSILGTVTVHELALVVARAEVARLTAIPGVGKKTAERLVLELKGKLDPGPVQGGLPLPSAPVEAGSKAELLVGALTRMGFRPAEAERALSGLGPARELEGRALGDLVREALALLAR